MLELSQPAQRGAAGDGSSGLTAIELVPATLIKAEWPFVLGDLSHSVASSVPGLLQLVDASALTWS